MGYINSAKSNRKSVLCLLPKSKQSKMYFKVKIILLNIIIILLLKIEITIIYGSRLFF